jgi:hypothetical protein
VGTRVIDVEDLRQASEDFDLLRCRLLRAARAMAAAEKERAELLLRLVAQDERERDLHLPTAHLAEAWTNAAAMLALVEQVEQLAPTPIGEDARPIVIPESRRKD